MGRGALGTKGAEYCVNLVLGQALLVGAVKAFMADREEGSAGCGEELGALIGILSHPPPPSWSAGTCVWGVHSARLRSLMKSIAP